MRPAHCPAEEHLGHHVGGPGKPLLLPVDRPQPPPDPLEAMAGEVAIKYEYMTNKEKGEERFETNKT